MPPINIYKCSNCDFDFPPGWGGSMYVETDEGERIYCRHPGEDQDVKRVLGVSYSEITGSVWGGPKKARWWWPKKKKALFNLIFERTGFNSNCICLDCLNYMVLDLGDERSIWRQTYGFNRKKDKRQCNKCFSNNVKTNFELIGEVCPKCKRGIISEIVTGAIA